MFQLSESERRRIGIALPRKVNSCENHVLHFRLSAACPRFRKASTLFPRQRSEKVALLRRATTRSPRNLSERHFRQHVVAYATLSGYMYAFGPRRSFAATLRKVRYATKAVLKQNVGFCFTDGAADTVPRPPHRRIIPLLSSLPECNETLKPPLRFLNKALPSQSLHLHGTGVQ
jgi:hypothetical protein